MDFPHTSIVSPRLISHIMAVTTTNEESFLGAFCVIQVDCFHETRFLVHNHLQYEVSPSLTAPIIVKCL